MLSGLPNQLTSFGCVLFLSPLQITLSPDKKKGRKRKTTQVCWTTVKVMKNHWEAGCIRQMFSFLWLVCSHLTRYRNRKSIRLSISEPLDRRGRVYSVHMCVHACFSSVMPKGDLTDSLACDAGGKQKNIKAIFSRTVFSESWGRW